MTTRALVLLALVAGCDTWDNLPYNGGQSIDRPLWDPTGAVAATDGVYVPLPHAGRAALVAAGAEPVEVDLGDGLIRSLDVAPDGQTVLAFMERFSCDAGDDTERTLLDECYVDDRITAGQLGVVRAGVATTWFDLAPQYGPLTFSPDSRFAVTSLDPDAQFNTGGIINLTSLQVVDLVADTSWEVSVGFRADRVLFMSDDADNTVGAVVLSQSEVAVLDLAGQAPTPEVVFPLTLDPDQTLTPVGVSLTPSGSHALISIEGSADLYALDLVNPSVNIVSLAGRPAAMAVSPGADRTVLVYSNNPVVELLDHDLFDLQTIPLDEVMSDIHVADDFALLYSTVGRLDAYRLDLNTGTTDEYRLAWAPAQMHVAPDASFALSFNGDATQPRMELVDLTPGVDGRIDTDSRPFGLEGLGIGAAFATDEGGTTALILQDGVDTLAQLHYPSLALSTLDLPAPPRAIGALPDGGFWITHDDALGLVSFYQPGGEVTSVSGFARFGLHDDIMLVVEEEE